MDPKQYLDRINFFEQPQHNQDCLIKLHRQHLYHVPFENLDIQAGKKISLDLDQLFNKIVINRRGGFCYELNYLFHWLLTGIGFRCRIISARVLNDSGQPGPEFDHMAIYIEGERNYLADVGFGDLFLMPLEFKMDDIQSDGQSFFKIQALGGGEYLLLMSSDGIQFKGEYQFNLTSRAIGDFMEQCADKQVSPDSHFVKNRICTKATPQGRWTIRNNQWIETINKNKSGFEIENDEQLKQILMEKFEVSI